jgi:ribonucleoside-diphosphate reductase beta chain
MSHQDSVPAETMDSTSAFKWHPLEKNRVALGPDVLHPDIYEFAYEIQSVHWFAHEVQYDEDRRQWDSGDIDDATKRVVEHILSFFSIADQVVLDNIGDNFMQQIAGECIDVKHVYVAIAEQERIHALAYKAQPEALYSTREDQVRVLDAVRTMPIIGDMVSWIRTYMDEARPIGERMVAFVVVEGIWFTGSFCLLQWLKQRNILPGITKANEFISRDEGIHVRFAAYLIREYLVQKPAFSVVEGIIRDGLKIAERFVNEAIPSRLAGMNADLMTQYLQFQTDCVMVEMGYRKIFETENPFNFMVNLCLKRKKNFFEEVPTEYTNITDPKDLEYGFNDSPVDLDALSTTAVVEETVEDTSDSEPAASGVGVSSTGSVDSDAPSVVVLGRDSALHDSGSDTCDEAGPVGEGHMIY